MEVNLKKMIEDYEHGEVNRHESTGQSDDSTWPDQTAQQVPEARETDSGEAEEDKTSAKSGKPSYEVREGYLFKLVDDKEVCLANFHPEIVAQHVRMDEGVMNRRDFHVKLT